MPKKDTATAVLGMLSTAGAQTRLPSAPPPPPEPPVAAEPDPVPSPAATAPELPAATPEPTAASVSRLPGPRPQQSATEAAAPRTLRLRPATATKLRNAWLEAKRDDVLLTAQDFASDLVEEALARHRRRRAASSS
jgi:hypothetical protein